MQLIIYAGVISFVGSLGEPHHLM